MPQAPLPAAEIGLPEIDYVTLTAGGQAALLVDSLVDDIHVTAVGEERSECMLANSILTLLAQWKAGREDDEPDHDAEAGGDDEDGADLEADIEHAFDQSDMAAIDGRNAGTMPPSPIARAFEGAGILRALIDGRCAMEQTKAGWRYVLDVPAAQHEQLCRWSVATEPEPTEFEIELRTVVEAAAGQPA